MQKKGIKMKQRIILVLLITLELVISVLICSRINIDKYDSWLETDAIVAKTNLFNAKNGFRENQSDAYYVTKIKCAVFNLNRHILFFTYFLRFYAILSSAPCSESAFNTRFIAASVCSSVSVASAERIVIEKETLFLPSSICLPL